MAAAASRDETKHSYIPSPETGSIRPAASPTSKPRSAAMGVPGRRSGRRWPRRPSSDASSIGAPRTAGSGAHGSSGPRSATRRRRRSRGRPWRRPTRSRPECRPTRRPRAARIAPSRRRRTARCPRTLRRGRCLRRARACGPSCRSRRRRRRRCRLRRLAVDRDPVAEPDLRPLSHLDAPLPRRVEQERVEHATLSHADHRLPRATLDRVAVAEPQLDDVHLLLDDRRRVDGALPDRPHRHPAAARLVAREARPVDEQHRRTGVGEAVARWSSRPARPRRRGRRNAASREATIPELSRGCARAAKGNGL